MAPAGGGAPAARRASGRPLIATFHSACVRILRERAIQHLGYPPVLRDLRRGRPAGPREGVLRELGLDERDVTPGRGGRTGSATPRTSMLGARGRWSRRARGPREERRRARSTRRYEARLRAAGARRLRRPPAPDGASSSTTAPGGRSTATGTSGATCWSTSTRTPTAPSTASSGCSPRSTGTSAWWAIPTSPSTAGAARTSGTSSTSSSDFPGCRVVRLEQNYRSTKQILEIAAAVIAHNPARKDKRLWTENAAGEPARLFRAWDENEEALLVARTVARACARRAWPLDDVAVFYRTNAQSRVLEDALPRGGLPYLIVGGVRFYERQEIKDALAYLRLVVEPGRRPGLPAGARRAAARDRAHHARPPGRSSRRPPGCRSCDGRASARRRARRARPGRALEDFARLIARLGGGRGAPAAGRARRRRSSTAPGYRDALRREGTAEAESRLENLEELVVAAGGVRAREPEGGDLAGLPRLRRAGRGRRRAVRRRAPP